jgi:hypothetical protein
MIDGVPVDDDSDVSLIELHLPSSVRFAPVVRVVAASLAADEDFAIGALAELRVAVEEAFNTVVQQTVPVNHRAADEALVIRFSISSGCVHVEFVDMDLVPTAEGPTSAEPRLESRAVGDFGHMLMVAPGRITLTKSTTVRDEPTTR